MNIIEQIARENHEDPKKVRTEMEATLDETFANPDPEVQKKLKAYFPNGKPTVEEFITKIADVISARIGR